MDRIKNRTPTPSKTEKESVRSVNSVKIQQLVLTLLGWFSRHARDLPWRRTRDPYAIWVSEIMLQQTQVKTVLPYWERWMPELPTIESLAKARPEKIHKLWEGLGYYTRVRNLQKAARLVLEKHGGQFPENFSEILALPGIGRYTAGAVCSIAFNQPTPILDGNVTRVLTRIFGIGENPREKRTNTLLWQLAEELVLRASRPQPCAASPFALRTSHFNQSLMELGALVCTPRQPKCPTCPVKKFCVAFRENRVGQLPNLAKPAPATRRHFHAFIVERGGKFLVRQRPAGVVNSHLWEFPNVEIHGSRSKARNARRPLLAKQGEGRGEGTIWASSQVPCAATGPGRKPVNVRPLCVIKHSITRYRITLEVFAVDEKTAKALVNGDGRWLTLPQLGRLPFPSAHRKILNSLVESR